MIDNLSRKMITFFKSDLGVRFVAEGVVRSNAFILTPLLSWSLGAVVFGSYLQLMSLAFAFVPLVSAGLGFTVIRKLAGRTDSSDAPNLLLTAIGIVSFLCLSLMLILAFTAENVLIFLSLNTILAPSWLTIVVPSLAWIFAVEALIGEYMRAMVKARLSLYIQIVSFALQMAFLGVVLTFDKLSLGSTLLSIAAAKVVVIAYLLIPILIRIKKHSTKNKSSLLQVALSGLPFMLAGLAEWAGNLGDRLIVGRFLGPEAVAHYGASIMILSVLAALGAPIWWLLFPTVSAHVRNGETEHCRVTVRQRTMLFTELALPILALAILVVNPAVSLLLNSPVSNMTAVILLAGCAILISQMTTGWEYYLVCVSSGKRLMTASVICSLLSFGSAWQLAPSWGLVGVASGMLIGKATLGLFFAISANRNGFVGCAWPMRSFVTLVTVNGITAITTYFFAHQILTISSLFYQIAFSAVIFAATYGAIRFLLTPVLQRLNAQ